jgi:peptidoglycan hydrolase-like protein with peptidoglycan-binding domain
VYRGSLSYGARGPFVGVIQHDLQRVGYPATSSQVFDGRTGRAVLSYRKVNGLGRTSSADRATINKILSGRGGYPVRYPSHGRHVEADLSRQVLAEIDGNRVHAVYDVSSGKPSTPTVLGSFRFYRKQPGTNSHGMVFSTYFIGGYAIHGYKSVPNYPASHGCLRIPIPDAVSVYRWTHIGDRIDVYP